jgi:putative spermidine/putrescine transport system permease protein
MMRRITGWFNQHPRATLRALLAGPLGWISIVYLGSLFILLMHAFWSKDSFTGKVEPFNWTLDAFAQILSNPVYFTIAARTIGIAALVTITAAAIALPVAYYMARIASPRKRALLLVAVTMPLWASYLVKIYAWRTILQTNGLLGWAISPLGLEGPGLTEIANSWLVLTYLWLPYMISPSMRVWSASQARCLRPPPILAAAAGSPSVASSSRN